MNIFEKASRSKLRFETSKGSLATEDLWTVSLSSLDVMARNINKTIIGSAEDVSFLDSTTKVVDLELELKLDILKHIIKTRQEEAASNRVKEERKQELQMLQNLMASKQHDALMSLSAEEISKRINELKATF